MAAHSLSLLPNKSLDFTLGNTKPMLIKSFRKVFFVLLFIALTSAVLFQKVTAQQVDDLIFYEGNGCTQDIVFTYNSYQAANDNCKKSGSCNGDNDEARSLRIAKSVNPRASIVLYDSPSGDATDDHTVIDVVNRQFMQPEWYCLRTFENTFSNPYLNSGIQVDYFQKNGLDGKVSRVVVIPTGRPGTTTRPIIRIRKPIPTSPNDPNGINDGLPPVCKTKPNLPQCN